MEFSKSTVPLERGSHVSECFLRLAFLTTLHHFSDNHGKAVDPPTQIYCPTCQDNTADSCMVFKHGTPPAEWKKAACRKYCLRVRA